MSHSSPISSAAHYYQYEQNGFIYKEDIAEEIQDEAYKAMLCTAEIFNNDPDAKFNSEGWQFFDATGRTTYSPSSDPLLMMMYSRVSLFKKYCGPIDCSFGNSTGRRMAFAIAAVIFPLIPIVSFVFTIQEGVRAEKIRAKPEEIRLLKEQATKQLVKDTYDKMIPILRKQYVAAVTNTLSRTVVTVALCFLIAAALMAIYARIIAIPKPPLVNTFAIAGGSIMGGVWLASIFRAARNEINRDAGLKLYKDLFEKYFALYEFVSDPFKILDESPKIPAYIITNGCVVTKEIGGGHTWTLQKDRTRSLVDHTHLQFSIRKA